MFSDDNVRCNSASSSSETGFPNITVSSITEDKAMSLLYSLP